MSGKNKATPGPVCGDVVRYAAHGLTNCLADDNGHIASCENEEIASELMRRANTQPALRDALENIINGIESGAVRIETAQDETWANAMSKARAALSLAHGEG